MDINDSGDSQFDHSLAEPGSVVDALDTVVHALDIAPQGQGEGLVANGFEEEAQDAGRAIRCTIARQYQYRVAIAAPVLADQPAEPGQQAEALYAGARDFRQG